MKMLLTKKFSFEMAHALEGYDGKCANLHGHSYHLEVTVEETVTSTTAKGSGMQIDFGTLKKIVQQTIIAPYDHALVLKKGSQLAATAASALPNLKETDCNPTTENLLMHFATLLEPQRPEGTRLHSLRLAETDTSMAELLL